MEPTDPAYYMPFSAVTSLKWETQEYAQHCANGRIRWKKNASLPNVMEQQQQQHCSSSSTTTTINNTVFVYFFNPTVPPIPSRMSGMRLDYHCGVGARYSLPPPSVCVELRLVRHQTSHHHFGATGHRPCALNEFRDVGVIVLPRLAPQLLDARISALRHPSRWKPCAHVLVTHLLSDSLSWYVSTETHNGVAAGPWGCKGGAWSSEPHGARSSTRPTELTRSSFFL